MISLYIIFDLLTEGRGVIRMWISYPQLTLRYIRYIMDLEKLWKTVLAEVELSVTKPIYKTQFAQSRLVSLEHNVATIGFTNPLLRTIVESRYYSLLKSILDHHTGENISLLFLVVPKTEKLTGDQAGPLFSTIREQEITTLTLARRFHLRPEFTFENFAVSTTNQMAYAAATAVAGNPGSAYNPLFIYGGVGVGKTHLVQAVANSLLSKKPSLRVVYCMGEEFLNDIIEAIQTKTARLFKQKYRSAQLLLVDDVQFIAGKNTAQEEFFHTFNAVHREGAQIILTSDRPPSEIAKLEDRLRSRFDGGLTVDVSQPDFELRVAIVNIKSGALGIAIPPDAAQMIAANVTDARAMEGFLRRIITAVSAHPQPVTAELVASLFGERAPRPAPGAQPGPPRRRASPQEILEKVSGYFDIKTTVLKGPKRDRPIVRPRQVVMYLCKTELGLTLKDIGGLLGGRDHTTIIHGVETITRELSTNERLRQDVAGIKQRLWA